MNKLSVRNNTPYTEREYIATRACRCHSLRRGIQQGSRTSSAAAPSPHDPRRNPSAPANDRASHEGQLSQRRRRIAREEED